MVTPQAGSSAPELRPAEDAPVLLTALVEANAGLKRQLMRRMSVTGVMVLALLSVLAVLEYLRAPDDTLGTSPRFTEPVPVRKKEPAQPAQPVERQTPPLLQKAAGPQASGAAIDRPLPLPDTSSAVAGESQGVSGEAAEVAGKQPLAVAPRLLSGPSLQSGVVDDQRRAEELQARLAEQGLPSSIETRVQVGPFKNRAEAETAQRRMKALGIDGFSLVGKGSRP